MGRAGKKSLLSFYEQMASGFNRCFAGNPTGHLGRFSTGSGKETGLYQIPGHGTLLIYSIMEIQDIQTKLQTRREELAGRVDAIESDIRRQTQGGLSIDSEERAQELENDEVLDALDDQARDELGRIDAALERIEKGSYGACEKCGKPISAARLKELPYAAHCIGCA